MIYWKGQSVDCIDSDNVDFYFKGIFQSDKTWHHPTVSNIKNNVNAYSIQNEKTDLPITMDDLHQFSTT